MAMPTAAQQALALLKQGPVAMVIDPDSANVEVFVRGGVDLSFVRGQAAAEVDLIGEYDLYTTGDQATFEATVPEISNNAIAVLFPDGADGTTYRGFGRAAGLSLRTIAKLIRFRPWQTRTAATLQVELWKCVPEGDGQVTQQKDASWAITQSYRALPDLTKTDGQLIGKLTFPARS